MSEEVIIVDITLKTNVNILVKPLNKYLIARAFSRVIFRKFFSIRRVAHKENFFIIPCLQFHASQFFRSGISTLNLKILCWEASAILDYSQKTPLVHALIR